METNIHNEQLSATGVSLVSNQHFHPGRFIIFVYHTTAGYLLLGSSWNGRVLTELRPSVGYGSQPELATEEKVQLLADLPHQKAYENTLLEYWCDLGSHGTNTRQSKNRCDRNALI